MLEGLIDPTVFNLSPEGLVITQPYSNMVILHHTFSKEFFETYSPYDKPLPIPSIILDKLKFSFSKDSLSLQLSKEDKALLLDDGKDTYERLLEDFDNIKLPLKMLENEHGIIPTGINTETSFIIPKSELEFPPYKEYTIEMKSKKLSVHIGGDGNFTRKLEIKKPIEMKNVKLIFNGKFFDLVIKNLSGDLYCIIDSGSKLLPHGGILLCEKNEIYTKTYLLSPMNP
jgi:hypothetical protein